MSTNKQVSSELFFFNLNKNLDQSQYPQITCFSYMSAHVPLKTGKDLLLCSYGVATELCSDIEKETDFINAVTDKSTRYAFASMKCQIELFHADRISPNTELRLNSNSASYKMINNEYMRFLTSASTESNVTLDFLLDFPLHPNSDPPDQVPSEDISTTLQNEDPVEQINNTCLEETPVYQEFVKDTFLPPHDLSYENLDSLSKTPIEDDNTNSRNPSATGTEEKYVKPREYLSVTDIKEGSRIIQTDQNILIPTLEITNLIKIPQLSAEFKLYTHIGNSGTTNQHVLI